MCWRHMQCLCILLLLTGVWALPLSLIPEHPPLAAELSSRMAAHSSRLQEPSSGRLPIPTMADLEAVRKVAQVLVMLGQQVIPAIIGEAPGTEGPSTEIPNDPVASN